MRYIGFLTLNDRQSTLLAESLRSFLDKSRRKEESGKGKERKLKKVLSVKKHGFVFWAQRKPNARLEIYKAFQDRLTYDSLNWLRFLDKSNLLKIPDWGSFIVLKTLTGYRPYSHSVIRCKMIDKSLTNLLTEILAAALNYFLKQFRSL